ncbi:nitrate- and nitrite sensing domain-containing protein [Marinobacter sp. M216]|uniref:Nitrate- and nitrite sensing domain-containing protein n=1 Tax=Marinobacter albus TaxID=3030833 RepID=A0ABT7HDS0_9GAMM|nr:nitrate- and nitrite sensing domain-containing protein [Marinobacter sp. M216]MDK9558497.1 nitrate- and nitrite sensing domain-containing protein [Marinobacter sp. M216]
MNTSRKQQAPTPPSAADYLIASRQCELMNLQYFLQMGKVVQSISNLVHGLQRERGASNVFLGSGGEKFVNERRATIAESERLAGIFEQALAEVHEELTAHPVSSHLLNHIASALHGLEELPALRAGVESRGLSAAEATEAYSGLIHEFITVVFEAADTAVDPSIAGLLVAMVHLMNGKEFCGQERAVGSAGFSSGGFDGALSKRMMHLVEAQERCFEVFVSFSDDQSRELWQTLRANDREVEIERLRQLGCSVGRYKSLDPELADHWFRLMSERMDELKTVEDAVEGSFHTRCVERFAEARNSLAHQETLIASLDQQDTPSQPLLVLCDSGDDARAGESWNSDGVGQQFGRSIFDLVQEQTRRLQQMNDELQSAKEALEDRKTQEKAVLLLMDHRKIDNDEAHRVLRKLAMDQGKKLPEVARALVSMADVLK